MPQKRATPTIKRRRVGAQLRRWRGDMKSGDAAKLMGWDITRLSRIERGTYRVSGDEVRAFTAKLGVTDTEAVEAVALAAEEPMGAGWWAPYAGHVSEPLLDFVQLEAEATTIRVQHGILIPGLLQSPGYIREMVKQVAKTKGPRQAGLYINLRLARQSVLSRLTRLHALFPESALHAQFDAGPSVMRDQIVRLLDAADQPNTELQMVPLTIHPTYIADGATTILIFDKPWVNVGSVDGPLGGTHVEDRDQVAWMEEDFALLAEAALSAEDTRVRLREYLERLSK